MISLIRDDCLGNDWLTEDELLNFIAVSESTPGPIAVNMATFVGSSEGGILGAFLATLGVVLPSFVIILIVASVLKNLLKYPPIKSLISGMRPALCGLILSVAITMALTVFFGVDNISTEAISLDWRTLVLLLVVIGVALVWKHFRKKEFSSILLVVLSAVMGMLMF